MNERDTTKKQNLIFFGIMAAILGVVLLYFLLREPALDSELTSVAQEPGEHRDVLEAVSLIKAMRLDTTIFEDPQFRALRDVTVPVELTTPKGRFNPFLPI